MTLQLVEPAGWHLEALCAEIGGDAWFPEKGESCNAAKRICQDCPVRAECLQYSLDNDERFGVWGGLSERERRRLRSGDLTVLTDHALWRCQVCGAQLNMRGRVCSAACRHHLQVRERPTRSCLECEAPIAEKSLQFKYCSTQCRQRAYDRKRPYRGSTKRAMTCKHCGNGFQGTKGARYCSVECRQKGKTTYTLEPREIFCAECGDAFMGRGGRATYCSGTCRDRAQYRRTKKGRRSA